MKAGKNTVFEALKKNRGKFLWPLSWSLSCRATKKIPFFCGFPKLVKLFLLFKIKENRPFCIKWKRIPYQYLDG